MTDAFRFGVGLGFAFVFDDFCVCGEAACVGVGAFAAGVEADAGVDTTVGSFFFVDGGVIAGLVCAGVATLRGLACAICGVATFASWGVCAACGGWS